MVEHYPGFGADLALVVARTRHARYRHLTDPGHPAWNPGYVPIVAAEAARLRAGRGLAPARGTAVPRARKPRIPLGVPQKHG